MKKFYEAWRDEDNCSITFALAEGIVELQALGDISDKAVFLYCVEADTPEQAMMVHHVKMGWEPFVPMGEAKKCPKGCGSLFYPEGSGDCPNCGSIC